MDVPVDIDTGKAEGSLVYVQLWNFDEIELSNSLKIGLLFW